MRESAATRPPRWKPAWSLRLPSTSILNFAILVLLASAETTKSSEGVAAQRLKALTDDRPTATTSAGGNSKLYDDDNNIGASAPTPVNPLDPILPKAAIADDAHMDVVAQQWAAQHPEDAQTGSIIWSIGLLSIALGIAVMLYSEISTVLYYREVDDIIAADVDGAPPSVELRQREYLWGNGLDSRYRPSMTIGGATVVVLSFTAMFYSQCPMIDQISAEFDISETSYEGSCSLVALKQSVITGLGLVFFLVGLTWCCTRFFPALLLLLLSIGSDIAGSYKGAVPVLLWVLAVVGGAAVYSWLKSLDNEDAAADAGGGAEDGDGAGGRRRRRSIPRRQFV